MDLLRRGGAPVLLYVFVGFLRIVGFSFPFNDLQGPGGTYIETCTEAVTVDLSHQYGLVLLIQFKGPFGTGGGAEPASVAELPVYFDYLSFHMNLSLISRRFFMIGSRTMDFCKNFKRSIISEDTIFGNRCYEKGKKTL